MGTLHRLVAAATALAALVALVACDASVATLRSWFDAHALTASVVANLLTVAVTLLVVDQIVARRRQKERAVSVAVQSLILYAQARRAHRAVVAAQRDGSWPGVEEELRSLAALLLAASAALFDDPAARAFLEQLQRSSASMVRVVRRASAGNAARDDDAQLEGVIADMQHAIIPLLRRIPDAEREMIEADG
jgi:hypothetical protein